MIYRYFVALTVVLASLSTLVAATVTDASYQIGMTYSGSGSPTSASYSGPGNYTLGPINAFVSGLPNLANQSCGSGPGLGFGLGYGDLSVNLAEQVCTPESGSVFAQTGYYFYVVTPDLLDGTTVPLLIQARLAATATGGSSIATAQVGVTTAIQLTGVAVQSDGVASFNGTFLVNYLSGSGYYGFNSLTLYVGASASDPGSWAESFGDPYIYVDPSFPGAANDTVIVSDGIGNSADAAPEPASFLLTAGALAGIALLRRRNGWAK